MDVTRGCIVGRYVSVEGYLSKLTTMRRVSSKRYVSFDRPFKFPDRGASGETRSEFGRKSQLRRNRRDLQAISNALNSAMNCESDGIEMTDDAWETLNQCVRRTHVRIISPRWRPLRPLPLILRSALSAPGTS